MKNKKLTDSGFSMTKSIEYRKQINELFGSFCLRCMDFSVVPGKKPQKKRKKSFSLTMLYINLGTYDELGSSKNRFIA